MGLKTFDFFKLIIPDFRSPASIIRILLPFGRNIIANILRLFLKPNLFVGQVVLTAINLQRKLTTVGSKYFFWNLLFMPFFIFLIGHYGLVCLVSTNSIKLDLKEILSTNQLIIADHQNPNYFVRVKDLLSYFTIKDGNLDQIFSRLFIGLDPFIHELRLWFENFRAFGIWYINNIVVRPIELTGQRGLNYLKVYLFIRTLIVKGTPENIKWHNTLESVINSQDPLALTNFNRDLLEELWPILQDLNLQEINFAVFPLVYNNLFLTIIVRTIFTAVSYLPLNNLGFLKWIVFCFSSILVLALFLSKVLVSVLAHSAIKLFLQSYKIIVYSSWSLLTIALAWLNSLYDLACLSIILTVSSTQNSKLANNMLNFKPSIETSFLVYKLPRAIFEYLFHGPISLIDATFNQFDVYSISSIPIFIFSFFYRLIGYFSGLNVNKSDSNHLVFNYRDPSTIVFLEIADSSRRYFFITLEAFFKNIGIDLRDLIEFFKKNFAIVDQYTGTFSYLENLFFQSKDLLNQNELAEIIYKEGKKLFIENYFENKTKQREFLENFASLLTDNKTGNSPHGFKLEKKDRILFETIAREIQLQHYFEVSPLYSFYNTLIRATESGLISMLKGTHFRYLKLLSTGITGASPNDQELTRIGGLPASFYFLIIDNYSNLENWHPTFKSNNKPLEYLPNSAIVIRDLVRQVNNIKIKNYDPITGDLWFLRAFISSLKSSILEIDSSNITSSDISWKSLDQIDRAYTSWLPGSMLNFNQISHALTKKVLKTRSGGLYRFYRYPSLAVKTRDLRTIHRYYNIQNDQVKSLGEFKAKTYFKFLTDFDSYLYSYDKKGLGYYQINWQLLTTVLLWISALEINTTNQLFFYLWKIFTDGLNLLTELTIKILKVTFISIPGLSILDKFIFTGISNIFVLTSGQGILNRLYKEAVKFINDNYGWADIFVRYLLGSKGFANLNIFTGVFGPLTLLLVVQPLLIIVLLLIIQVFWVFIVILNFINIAYQEIIGFSFNFWQEKILERFIKDQGDIRHILFVSEEIDIARTNHQKTDGEALIRIFFLPMKFAWIVHFFTENLNNSTVLLLNLAVDCFFSDKIKLNTQALGNLLNFMVSVLLKSLIAILLIGPIIFCSALTIFCSEISIFIVNITGFITFLLKGIVWTGDFLSLFNAFDPVLTHDCRFFTNTQDTVAANEFKLNVLTNLVDLISLVTEFIIYRSNLIRIFFEIRHILTDRIFGLFDSLATITDNNKNKLTYNQFLNELSLEPKDMLGLISLLGTNIAKEISSDAPAAIKEISKSSTIRDIHWSRAEPLDVDIPYFYSRGKFLSNTLARTFFRPSFWQINFDSWHQGNQKNSIEKIQDFVNLIRPHIRLQYREPTFSDQFYQNIPKGSGPGLILRHILDQGVYHEDLIREKTLDNNGFSAKITMGPVEAGINVIFICSSLLQIGFNLVGVISLFVYMLSLILISSQIIIFSIFLLTIDLFDIIPYGTLIEKNCSQLLNALLWGFLRVIANFNLFKTIFYNNRTGNMPEVSMLLQFDRLVRRLLYFFTNIITSRDSSLAFITNNFDQIKEVDNYPQYSDEANTTIFKWEPGYWLFTGPAISYNFRHISDLTGQNYNFIELLNMLCCNFLITRSLLSTVIMLVIFYIFQGFKGATTRSSNIAKYIDPFTQSHSLSKNLDLRSFNFPTADKNVHPTDIHLWNVLIALVYFAGSYILGKLIVSTIFNLEVPALSQIDIRKLFIKNKLTEPSTSKIILILIWTFMGYALAMDLTYRDIRDLKLENVSFMAPPSTDPDSQPIRVWFSKYQKISSYGKKSLLAFGQFICYANLIKVLLAILVFLKIGQPGPTEERLPGWQIWQSLDRLNIWCFGGLGISTLGIPFRVGSHILTTCIKFRISVDYLFINLTAPIFSLIASVLPFFYFVGSYLSLIDLLTDDNIDILAVLRVVADMVLDIVLCGSFAKIWSNFQIAYKVYLFKIPQLLLFFYLGINLDMVIIPAVVGVLTGAIVMFIVGILDILQSLNVIFRAIIYFLLTVGISTLDANTIINFIKAVSRLYLDCFSFLTQNDWFTPFYNGHSLEFFKKFTDSIILAIVNFIQALGWPVYQTPTNFDNNKHPSFAEIITKFTSDQSITGRLEDFQGKGISPGFFDYSSIYYGFVGIKKPIVRDALRHVDRPSNPGAPVPPARTQNSLVTMWQIDSNLRSLMIYIGIASAMVPSLKNIVYYQELPIIKLNPFRVLSLLEDRIVPTLSLIKLSQLWRIFSIYSNWRAFILIFSILIRSTFVLERAGSFPRDTVAKSSKRGLVTLLAFVARTANGIFSQCFWMLGNQWRLNRVHSPNEALKHFIRLPTYSSGRYFNFENYLLLPIRANSHGAPEHHYTINSLDGTFDKNVRVLSDYALKEYQNKDDLRRINRNFNNVLKKDNLIMFIPRDNYSIASPESPLNVLRNYLEANPLPGELEAMDKIIFNLVLAHMNDLSVLIAYRLSALTNIPLLFASSNIFNFLLIFFKSVVELDDYRSWNNKFSFIAGLLVVFFYLDFEIQSRCKTEPIVFARDFLRDSKRLLTSQYSNLKTMSQLRPKKYQLSAISKFDLDSTLTTIVISFFNALSANKKRQKYWFKKVEAALLKYRVDPDDFISGNSPFSNYSALLEAIYQNNIDSYRLGTSDIEIAKTPATNWITSSINNFICFILISNMALKIPNYSQITKGVEYRSIEPIMFSGWVWPYLLNLSFFIYIILIVNESAIKNFLKLSAAVIVPFLNIPFQLASIAFHFYYSLVLYLFFTLNKLMINWLILPIVNCILFQTIVWWNLYGASFMVPLLVLFVTTNPMNLTRILIKSNLKYYHQVVDQLFKLSQNVKTDKVKIIDVIEKIVGLSFCAGNLSQILKVDSTLSDREIAKNLIHTMVKIFLYQSNIDLNEKQIEQLTTLNRGDTIVKNQKNRQELKKIIEKILNSERVSRQLTAIYQQIHQIKHKYQRAIERLRTKNLEITKKALADESGLRQEQVEFIETRKVGPFIVKLYELTLFKITHIKTQKLIISDYSDNSYLISMHLLHNYFEALNRILRELDTRAFDIYNSGSSRSNQWQPDNPTKNWKLANIFDLVDQGTDLQNKLANYFKGLLELQDRYKDLEKKDSLVSDNLRSNFKEDSKKLHCILAILNNPLNSQVQTYRELKETLDNLKTSIKQNVNSWTDSNLPTMLLELISQCLFTTKDIFISLARYITNLANDKIYYFLQDITCRIVSDIDDLIDNTSKRTLYQFLYNYHPFLKKFSKPILDNISFVLQPRKISNFKDLLKTYSTTSTSKKILQQKMGPFKILIEDHFDSGNYLLFFNRQLNGDTTRGFERSVEDDQQMKYGNILYDNIRLQIVTPVVSRASGLFRFLTRSRRRVVTSQSHPVKVMLFNPQAVESKIIFTTQNENINQRVIAQTLLTSNLKNYYNLFLIMTISSPIVNSLFVINKISYLFIKFISDRFEALIYFFIDNIIINLILTRAEFITETIGKAIVDLFKRVSTIFIVAINLHIELICICLELLWNIISFVPNLGFFFLILMVDNDPLVALATLQQDIGISQNDFVMPAFVKRRLENFFEYLEKLNNSGNILQNSITGEPTNQKSLLYQYCKKIVDKNSQQQTIFNDYRLQDTFGSFDPKKRNKSLLWRPPTSDLLEDQETQDREGVTIKEGEYSKYLPTIKMLRALSKKDLNRLYNNSPITNPLLFLQNTIDQNFEHFSKNPSKLVLDMNGWPNTAVITRPTQKWIFNSLHIIIGTLIAEKDVDYQVLKTLFYLSYHGPLTEAFYQQKRDTIVQITGARRADPEQLANPLKVRTWRSLIKEYLTIWTDETLILVLVDSLFFFFNIFLEIVYYIESIFEILRVPPLITYLVGFLSGREFIKDHKRLKDRNIINGKPKSSLLARKLVPSENFFRGDSSFLKHANRAIDNIFEQSNFRYYRGLHDPRKLFNLVKSLNLSTYTKDQFKDLIKEENKKMALEIFNDRNLFFNFTLTIFSLYMLADKIHKTPSEYTIASFFELFYLELPSQDTVSLLKAQETITITNLLNQLFNNEVKRIETFWDVFTGCKVLLFHFLRENCSIAINNTRAIQLNNTIDKRYFEWESLIWDFPRSKNFGLKHLINQETEELTIYDGKNLKCRARYCPIFSLRQLMELIKKSKDFEAKISFSNCIRDSNPRNAIDIKIWQSNILESILNSTRISIKGLPAELVVPNLLFTNLKGGIPRNYNSKRLLKKSLDVLREDQDFNIMGLWFIFKRDFLEKWLQNFKGLDNINNLDNVYLNLTNSFNNRHNLELTVKSDWSTYTGDKEKMILTDHFESIIKRQDDPYLEFINQNKKEDKKTKVLEIASKFKPFNYYSLFLDNKLAQILQRDSDNLPESYNKFLDRYFILKKPLLELFKKINKSDFEIYQKGLTIRTESDKEFYNKIRLENLNLKNKLVEFYNLNYIFSVIFLVLEKVEYYKRGQGSRSDSEFIEFCQKLRPALLQIVEELYRLFELKNQLTMMQISWNLNFKNLLKDISKGFNPDQRYNDTLNFLSRFIRDNSTSFNLKYSTILFDHDRFEELKTVNIVIDHLQKLFTNNDILTKFLDIQLDPLAIKQIDRKFKVWQDLPLSLNLDLDNLKSRVDFELLKLESSNSRAHQMAKTTLTPLLKSIDNLNDLFEQLPILDYNLSDITNVITDKQLIHQARTLSNLVLKVIDDIEIKEPNKTLDQSLDLNSPRMFWPTSQKEINQLVVNSKGLPEAFTYRDLYESFTTNRL